MIHLYIWPLAKKTLSTNTIREVCSNLVGRRPMAHVYLQ